MTKNIKKKVSKYEKKRRRNTLIVGILVIGFILTTILSILMSGIS